MEYLIKNTDLRVEQNETGAGFLRILWQGDRKIYWEIGAEMNKKQLTKWAKEHELKKKG